MDDKSEKKTACPVCGKLFPDSFINSHVNDCLNQTGTAEQETRPKKRKSSDMSAASGWGFLRSSGEHAANAKKPKLGANSKQNLHNSSKGSTEKKTNDKDSDDDMVILDDLHETNPTSDVEKTRLSSSKSFITSKNRYQTPTSSDANPKSSRQPGENKKKFAPLAERMRPVTLEGYVGQSQAVGRGSLLYSLLRSEHIPSMVFWGPPGCGKTTLAKIIAHSCKSRQSVKFVQLSAAVAGVNEVKQVVTVAKNDRKMFKKKTILFLDEIHRFNKTQQDSLLPHVEDGTLTLIGATTENPSFQVNSALLSRCRVIVLEKLQTEELTTILQRAAEELGAWVVESLEELEEEKEEEEDGSPRIYIEKQALTCLAELCDGDARSALNSLQMTVESRVMAAKINADENHNKVVMVTKDHVKEGLQRSHVLYDRAGEEHYNIISAMHKSIRGSDASAALYWLARMLEGGENPLYVARRLVRIASEDVGVADPLALTQAVSTHQACHFIGMPECDVILAQCVVYLARAPKSVEVYTAYRNAKSCVRDHAGPLPSVPLHLRNASTKLMKNLGYGAGYKYNPDYQQPVQQEYFPVELRGTDFFS